MPIRFRLLTEADVKAVLTMDDLIDTMSSALQRLRHDQQSRKARAIGAEHDLLAVEELGLARQEDSCLPDRLERREQGLRRLIVEAGSARATVAEDAVAVSDQGVEQRSRGQRLALRPG